MSDLKFRMEQMYIGINAKNSFVFETIRKYFADYHRRQNKIVNRLVADRKKRSNTNHINNSSITVKERHICDPKYKRTLKYWLITSLYLICPSSFSQFINFIKGSFN